MSVLDIMLHFTQQAPATGKTFLTIRTKKFGYSSDKDTKAA